MFCTEDMYGNNVTPIPIDMKKNKARNVYLNNLPEYRKLQSLREIEKKRSGKAFVFSILFALSLLSIFALLALFSFIAEGFGIIGFMIGVIFSIITCILFAKYKQPDKTIEAQKRNVFLHNTKPAYYSNNNVIGYSIMDHTKTDEDGHTTYYYAYYEIDKRNIQSIGYDAKFAEYVLILYKPVYIHYNLPPTNEFRLQDVFADDILTDVLRCSLPPKNIPF
jgi:hypothetical protein